MEDNLVDNDYEQRLAKIQKAVAEFNPTVEAIEENMRLISKHKDKIRELSLEDHDGTYIQLHHSKHKEFIDLITKLHDINRNLDQYKSTRECQSLDYPRVKAYLQQQEAVFRDNLRAVKEVEISIQKLDSFLESNIRTTKP